MGRKVAIIGLDCADPHLVFDCWLDDLPNIRNLVQEGMWGPLSSVDPPITVPAWSCMMTGRDPGELGIYGFRNRQDFSYSALSVADSRAVPVDRIWEVLGRAGKQVLISGVPQTYPPTSVAGALICGFMTPDPRQDTFTYPPDLREEIEALVGPYRVDVRNYRRDDRDRILAEIYEMTEQHFRVAHHLLDTRAWDFFMMVEIGLDRIHHAFWRFFDPVHPKYEPGHRYLNVVRAYYQYLDEQIGEMLERFDDETTVFVVSDHGGQPMQGAICINEWLMQEGYLVLHQPPEGITPFHAAAVDWSRTTAWGEGGYYGRLMCNVRGREPQGLIEPSDYEQVRDELMQKLASLPGPDGHSIGTKVYRPEDLWREQNGIPPDLIVYFGDLAWRSNGSIGHGTYYTFENDTGPDDANHSKLGLCIGRGPGIAAGYRDDLTIYDIAPTIVSVYDLPPLAGLRGQALTD